MQSCIFPKLFKDRSHCRLQCEKNFGRMEKCSDLQHNLNYVQLTLWCHFKKLRNKNGLAFRVLWDIHGCCDIAKLHLSKQTLFCPVLPWDKKQTQQQEHPNYCSSSSILSLTVFISSLDPPLLSKHLSKLLSRVSWETQHCNYVNMPTWPLPVRQGWASTPRGIFSGCGFLQHQRHKRKWLWGSADGERGPFEVVWSQRSDMSESDCGASKVEAGKEIQKQRRHDS